MKVKIFKQIHGFFALFVLQSLKYIEISYFTSLTTAQKGDQSLEKMFRFSYQKNLGQLYFSKVKYNID